MWIDLLIGKMYWRIYGVYIRFLDWYVSIDFRKVVDFWSYYKFVIKMKFGIVKYVVLYY